MRFMTLLSLAVASALLFTAGCRNGADQYGSQDANADGRTAFVIVGEHEERVRVAGTSNASHLYAGDDSGHIRSYVAEPRNTVAWKPIAQHSLHAIVTCADSAETEEGLLVVGLADGRTAVVSLEQSDATAKVRRVWKEAVLDVAWSPDMQRYYAIAKGAFAAKVPVRGRGDARHLDIGGPGTQYAAFSPDARRLAIVRAGYDLEVWEVETGRRVVVLPGQGQMPPFMAWSNDGKELAFVDPTQGVVKILNVGNGKVVETYRTGGGLMFECTYVDDTLLVAITRVRESATGVVDTRHRLFAIRDQNFEGISQYPWRAGICWAIEGMPDGRVVLAITEGDLHKTDEQRHYVAMAKWRVSP